MPWPARLPYVVFAGRLTAEKGVVSLQSWQAWGESAPELRLVGDGDLRHQLEEMAKGLPIRFLGQVAGGEAQNRLPGHDC